ncbi:MAG: antibiotic biosynthesis monooxygenase [Myxococcota bacterium]
MFRSIQIVFSTALVAGCAIAQPFEGPGYADGVLTSDAEGPFVAAATHTRAKIGAGNAFDAQLDAILDQLDAQPGLVGLSLRGEILGRDKWTLTVWETEEDLAGFVTSDAHLEAMGQADALVDAVYSATWSTTEVPPSWDEVLDELAEVEPSDPW